MRYVKWTFLTVIALIVVGFFHYTLPQHDVVRVVGTYQERQDLSDWTRIFWATPDDQSTGLINRDVQFIQAVKANGKEVVYRNEDTGWNWPPYFKFDTANLLARAQDMISTSDNPKWAVVTHYGWRNIYFSSFPNAISIKPVAGPDVTIIPWFNIFFFVFLAVILLMLRRMWLQFRERSIDPVLEDMGEAWDSVEDRAGAAATEARGVWGRFKAWLGTWRGKPRV
ncbi:uncharacterized protein DUF1523 [Defluviimonas denitrificans]|jgi:hypothetical protein|uniref:Uncharacterized protein DUF1523 n=1 Tax=Albidovulum denitrificans TaxID=404881 RepID=A0A2S8S6C8_9RHOB|nr:DUF1523 family protein [Defluviimonas denitrificans]PQV56345.1 uncharacterized protein DUF1523 [Defluviimonas denitrificans]